LCPWLNQSNCRCIFFALSAFSPDISDNLTT
jgi:hypothetical protein